MGSKSKGSEIIENNNNKDEDKNNKKLGKLEKSYFEVLGLCCSSEVPLIEKILKPLIGVVQVSVIVPSRTVIVLHDPNLISNLQIVKVLNQARLEASVRVKGKANFKGKWPSPYVFGSGILLALSFLKYVYRPLEWLAVAAVVVGVWPIFIRGFVAVRNFTIDVNILMLIAVAGTVVLRDYTEAGTIVFIFTIAEWLESRASHKATAVMSSLMSIGPQTATIAETGEVVNVEDVKLNTILAVKAGEIMPVDGIVVEGTCEADEKTLTGESFPVAKQKGSTVWAGTVNVNGYVSIRTTALTEDCAVAKLARLVEEAQNNKSSVQRLIDKCAKYYTPAVVLISAGLAVVPIALKLHDPRHWFHLALVVLVSACPCGLILSTPVATFCALSRAATSGLLIKGGDYLEVLAKIKTIAFDKTGTVTRGEFTLMNFETFADDVSLRTLLYWVSSIESKSSHPIAAVVIDYAQSQSIDPKPESVDDFQNFPGEGVFGKIDGRDIYIGNQKIGQRANYTSASTIGGHTKEGRTSGYVYSGGALIGTFGLSDNCRSGAADAIKELKSMGMRTALLTGDSKSAAMHAQEQLGHALDLVHAELLPEDKARIIQEYKLEGPTAMVGDGVNDAPALATADVGISMGVSGSALATETGHVVLMSNDIRKIPHAIELARKTQWKVIQNIAFSITTKAAVLAFAFAGHPLVWLAVLADVFTCLIVILNSMLLLRSSHRHRWTCLGFFQGHSHKKESSCSASQHCSKMNQQCCSKNAAHQSHSKHEFCRSEASQTNPDASKCCTQNFPSSCQMNSNHRHSAAHHHHHSSPRASAPCNNNSTAVESCCLDSLESQAGCGSDQHSLGRGGCCEADDKEQMIDSCTVQGTDVPHRENNSSLGCKSPCSRTHDPGAHHKADHHHHHGEAMAEHMCSSLRDREPGACCKSYRKECCNGLQGCDFGDSLGRLTEVITE